MTVSASFAPSLPVMFTEAARPATVDAATPSRRP